MHIENWQGPLSICYSWENGLHFVPAWSWVKPNIHLSPTLHLWDSSEVQRKSPKPELAGKAQEGKSLPLLVLNLL